MSERKRKKRGNGNDRKINNFALESLDSNLSPPPHYFSATSNKLFLEQEYTCFPLLQRKFLGPDLEHDLDRTKEI